MAAKKVIYSLGFVNIATRMEPAVDKDGSKDVHTVCTGNGTPHDPSRVKQAFTCPVCESSHSWAGGFAQKGTERDGKLVVLTNEELAGTSGAPMTGKEVPIPIGFHSREKVYAATVASDSVQNVTPDKGGEKGYLLLRDALTARPDLVGFVIWAPASKNALWALEVVGERIVASKRCFPEDVRPVAAIPQAEVTDVEANLFSQLVEQSVTDFDLSVYSDQSRLSMEALIASKVSEATSVSAAAPVAAGDILSAIQATLDKAVKKTPAKRAPAKKAPAKKAPAKKAPAKRAPRKAA